jgi:hypothetical protein
MNVDESLDRFGLVPPDDALPEIRRLLAREAEAERFGQEREEDLALLCCVQLFSRGHLEDALRIWDAKSAGMDLGAYLDVQLLCGGGLAATKQFLSSQPGAAAAAALSFLVECERAGDFQGFSPAQHFTRYREYFGVSADDAR